MIARDQRVQPDLDFSTVERLLGQIEVQPPGIDTHRTTGDASGHDGG